MNKKMLLFLLKIAYHIGLRNRFLLKIGVLADIFYVSPYLDEILYKSRSGGIIIITSCDFKNEDFSYLGVIKNYRNFKPVAIVSKRQD
jgi:hypothetical protein